VATVSDTKGGIWREQVYATEELAVISGVEPRETARYLFQAPSLASFFGGVWGFERERGHDGVYGYKG